jgi:hypothetical protein
MDALEKKVLSLGTLAKLKKIHKERLFIAKSNITSIINNLETYLLSVKDSDSVNYIFLDLFNLKQLLINI